MAIARGALQPNERLPSIRDLSVKLKVNANTIQRAYQELERSALIAPQRGTGYFVTDDKNVLKEHKESLAAEAISGFLAFMSALGYSAEEAVAALISAEKAGRQ